MNVLESRAGRPLRLRPWVLLLGAATVVVVVVVLTSGSSTPKHPDGANTGSSAGRSKTGSGSGGSAAGSSSFYLASSSPEADEQNVAPNATISLTFSAPLSLHTAEPTLS